MNPKVRHHPSIFSKAMPPGDSGLGRTLAEVADRIPDVTSAIQSESPSAVLTFWTRVVTDTIRRLAKETDFFISQADAVERFASQSRPTRNLVLDAGDQALIAQERARASTEPLAPKPELLSLLEDLHELSIAAYAAAHAQGA